MTLVMGLVGLLAYLALAVVLIRFLGFQSRWDEIVEHMVEEDREAPAEQQSDIRREGLRPVAAEPSLQLEAPRPG